MIACRFKLYVRTGLTSKRAVSDAFATVADVLAYIKGRGFNVVHVEYDGDDFANVFGNFRGVAPECYTIEAR